MVVPLRFFARCSRYKDYFGRSKKSTVRRVTRHFTVLALESSADDTCAAVVTSRREILSNIVIRQLDQHEVFGGIHPYVAIHEHQKNMPVAVRMALADASLNMSEIDGIAFTRGPGISGCLSVSSNAAKTLAAALGKPLVGVHHMQAHALTPLLTSPPSFVPTFPFLTLLISGGHTLLLLVLFHTRFKLLATTRDEAVGRTIDKVARNLVLKWEGRAPGAALEQLVRDGLSGVNEDDLPKIEPFVVPMKGRLEFSFSGLHSIVDRYILAHGVAGCDAPDNKQMLVLPGPHKLAIARAFQSAVVAQLEEKLVLSLQWCARNREGILQEFSKNCKTVSIGESKNELVVKHIVVSGGVASNMFFRQQLKKRLKSTFPDDNLSLVFPPPRLCTDNAAMIAWASMHRFLASDFDDYSIEHRAKWDIEKLTT